MSRVATLDRQDGLAISCLLGIGLLIPVALALAAGAIGIPTSDDWVYTQGAVALYRTGVITMPGHTAASIGQLLLVQPLLWISGGAQWSFIAYGVTMTAIAILCTYLLARRFVGTGSAALVVLLVLLFPGIARETPSFMTDIPAFALMMLCLLLGAMWLEGREEPGTFASSMAAGILAVSIREFAIAAPAAVLVVAWARSRPGQRPWLAVATGLYALSVIGVVLIATSIPARQPSSPTIHGYLFIGPVFMTLAAVLLPALSLGIGRRIGRFGPTPILVGGAVACALTILPWGLAAGNMWTETGFSGDILLNGGRDSVIEDGTWVFSRQVALFAAILLAAAIAIWARRHMGLSQTFVEHRSAVIRLVERRDAILVLFLLVYAIELVAFAPFWLYDRYVIPMVPAAAILLLQGRPQEMRLGRSLAFAHAGLAWLAFSAFVIASNSFAFDGARWREGEAAVTLGYQPQTVDAGYEWIGFHAGGLPVSGAPAAGMALSDRRWALLRPCAVVSTSPINDDGMTLIKVNENAYLRQLFFGPSEPLFLYGAKADTSSRACPNAPAS
jgi:hypothetical protein